MTKKYPTVIMEKGARLENITTYKDAFVPKPPQFKTYKDSKGRKLRYRLVHLGDSGSAKDVANRIRKDGNRARVEKFEHKHMLTMHLVYMRNGRKG